MVEFKPISLSAQMPPPSSDELAGIDREIQKQFMSLADDQLAIVFRRYEELHGKGPASYARRTYPLWKSSQVYMSGVVAERLIECVPAALDVGIRYEWIRKLRQKYLHREHRNVECNPGNWFRQVPPVVAELIETSSHFKLPEFVIAKLKWLVDDDAQAVQNLLAAAEVDEARLRTGRLAEEYHRIGRLLSNAPGESTVRHTIDIPQGTVAVTITLPRWTLLQRLQISPPPDELLGKAVLHVQCKNINCRYEIETNLKAYPDEPVLCSDGALKCGSCGATHQYSSKDLHHVPMRRRIEIRSGLFGKSIAYDCMTCGAELLSPINDAGISDICPRCRKPLRVPTPLAGP